MIGTFSPRVASSINTLVLSPKLTITSNFELRAKVRSKLISSRVIGHAVLPVICRIIQSQVHALDSVIEWIKVSVPGIDRQQGNLLATSRPLVHQRRCDPFRASNPKREDYKSDVQWLCREPLSNQDHCAAALI